MGLWKNILGTAVENITKPKEQRENEKAFVRNSMGSQAICAFITDLFEKGNWGYNWVKKERIGLYPMIGESEVSLCYLQPGDGQSFSGMMSKDIAVATFTFEEMYEWYGIDKSEGYSVLTTKIQQTELESMINEAVQSLPHIKYNVGYMVKMFQ